MLAELEGAQRLRYALADLHPSAAVTVVGGGLTGIEAAGELAEQGRSVTLVCGGILGPSLSGPGRRSVAKQLRKLGVNVLEAAAVSEVRWDSVVLNDGAVLASAATVWTAGFGVPDLAARSGLRTDSLGRLLTDETLTSISDRAHRRCRGCRRTLQPAAADELPGRRSRWPRRPPTRCCPASPGPLRRR